ncbi:MAG: NHL repeat-containing protein, partial [Planctomycetota bacterium]
MLRKKTRCLEGVTPMGMFAALIIGVAPIAQLDPLMPVDSWSTGLRSPARIAVAPDDTVLVTDPFNNYIARFDAAGSPLPTWSVPDGPIGIAAHPDGRYFVTLRDQAKVVIYDNTFNQTGLLGEGDPLVTFVKPTDIDVAT